MKSELQVKVNNQLGKINFNYEEIKENLAEMMNIYKETKVTVDTVAKSKKDIATLRKIKTALNDRRIAIKKEYMVPYANFEVKVKELTGLIDKPIVLIDKQVKEFEEQERLEKIEKIKDIYKEEIGELESYLTLEKIYNAKWENKSTTLKSIREEVNTVVSSTQMAVDTIKGMNSEVEDNALEQFKSDLSLANAITYINKHEKMKAEILAREEQKRKEEEERKRREEEERIRELERKRVAEEERIREDAKQKAIQEERQRIAKEEAQKRDLEEKRQVELEKIKEEDVEIVENAEEEPFIFSGKEPFTIDEEEPFNIEDDVKPFIEEEVLAVRINIKGTQGELNLLSDFLEKNYSNYSWECV